VRWLGFVWVPAIAAADTPRGTWTLDATDDAATIRTHDPDAHLPPCKHVRGDLRHVVLTYDGATTIRSKTWKYARRDNGYIWAELVEPIASTEVWLLFERDKERVHGAVIWVERDAHGDRVCGDGVDLAGTVTP
jgi:hypothetical protein